LASIEQASESALSANEMRQALIDQVKEKIESASIDQTSEDSDEQAKPEIWQYLSEQVQKKIESASIDQTSEDSFLVLVEEIKEMMLSNFEKVINEKEIKEKEIKEKALVVSIEQLKELAYYNDNAIFRLYIWRDMLVDLVNVKPILGFDFGKPFRSKSLEIIRWGEGDWSRDGWIAAHNSYLHMIYRTGLIGIALILSLLIVLFRMIKSFIVMKSLTGILLCTIFINWFVAANFLLIFELPYTAIPVWTLFGMTLAYQQSLLNKLSLIDEA